MKFKKGDRVEVMNHVKYDSYLGLTSEQTGGTMSRMFIRPCPPLVPGADCYAAGNIVEVLHEYSWKTAAVLKVLEGKKGNRASMFHRQASDTNNQYLVRLLGHSEKLVVSKSNMRMAQTWHDDKWTLMGKSPRGCDEITASKPSTSNYHHKMNVQISEFTGRTKNKPPRDCMDNQGSAFSKSPMISSKSLKRMSPYGSSVVQAHNGHGQKFIAIEKGGRRQRMNAAPLPEKFFDSMITYNIGPANS